MRRVLFDVNVILDVVLARSPHLAASSACLSAAETGRCEGRVAAHAVTTIFYLARRSLGDKGARRVVADLLAICAVAPVDGATIARAMRSDLPDFEDAVTAAAAEAAGCEMVVSRDPDGFAGAPVPSVAPELLLTLLTEEVREPEAPYGRRRRRAARAQPIEIYSEKQIREFAAADRMTPAMARRVKRALAKRKR